MPPSRGVFRGRATTELNVAVRVAPSEAPPPEEPLPLPDWGDAPKLHEQQ